VLGLDVDRFAHVGAEVVREFVGYHGLLAGWEGEERYDASDSAGEGRSNCWCKAHFKRHTQIVERSIALVLLCAVFEMVDSELIYAFLSMISRQDPDCL